MQNVVSSRGRWSELRRGYTNEAILSRSLLVVCPTEYGGQIEHAAEIAAAASRTAMFSRVILLSRPGAREATSGWKDSFELHETLLPRRPSTSPWRRVSQTIDLLRERAHIRRLVGSLQGAAALTILWETSKYGLTRRTSRVENVLFLHNAIPHEAKQMTLRDRLFFLQEQRTVRRATLTALHGEAQRAIVTRWRARRIVVVPLPGDSRTVLVSEQVPGALCLGEVRPNKGLENAIQAATSATIPLRVIGAPQPDSYGDQLRDHVRGSTATVDFRYLDADEFNTTLASAEVVLLPYTHFSAQSGVLAKAMQYGRRIIASDLDSLREQAGDYPLIEFVDPGSTDELASRLAALRNATTVETAQHHRETQQEWDDVARRIFG